MILDWSICGGVLSFILLCIVIAQFWRINSISKRVNRLGSSMNKNSKNIEKCATAVNSLKSDISMVRAEVVSRAVDRAINVTNTATGGSVGKDNER